MYLTEIFYKGEDLDLYEDKGLKYTIQVNDIGEIKDRQASYTNSYEVPKTPKNIRLLGGLALPSDTSVTPYTQDKCQVKIEGFDFIVKGWLNVKDTDDNFKIYIYSGIIEFFKAIENKTLGKDLDLTEIDHTKTLAAVVGSFSNNAYRYLITDYNGLTHFGDTGDKINIDYLVPSVNVRYLWDKVHSKYGFTFTGEIFNSSKFNNLWITYPKAGASGVTEGTQVVDLAAAKYATAWRADSDAYVAYAYLLYNNDVDTSSPDHTLLKYPYTSQYGQTFDNYGYFKAETAGYYEFDVNAIIKDLTIYTDVELALCFGSTLNGVNSNTAYNFKEYSMILSFTNGNPYTYEKRGTGTFIRYMNAGDYFVPVLRFSSGYTYQWTAYGNSETTINVKKKVEEQISFSEELSEYSITDFFKEVVNFFGLTPYPDEHSKKIDYLGMAERIVTAPVEDWTDKYVERESESYVFQDYAQKNIFSYQYNDKDSSYHDGYILINNTNLKDKKTVFKSKHYSPERDLSSYYLGSVGSKFLRIFKMYDKELKEDNGTQTIKYKGLDKRFHYARSSKLDTTVTIGSKSLSQETVVSSLPMADFSDLSWQQVVNTNYYYYGRVLNDSRIHRLSLHISPVDMMVLDLKKLYYFEQEQQYYFLNSVQYAGDNIAKAEAVRVKREDDGIIVPPDPTDPDIDIAIVWTDTNDSVDITGSETSKSVKIATLSYPVDEQIVSYGWQIDTGSGYVNVGSGDSPYLATLSSVLGATTKIRLAGISESGVTYYSNVLSYTLEAACVCYHAWRYGNSGDDVTIWYTDCDGVEQSVSSYASGGTLNVYIEVYANAQEGSATSNGNLGLC